MGNSKKVGFVLLFLGMIITFLASQIHNPNLVNDVGPRLFPYISGIGLIICGIGLIISKSKEANENYLTTEGWKRLSIMAAVIIFYAIGLATVGFIIATPIATFMAIVVMNGTNKNYKKALIVSLSLTISVYLIFEKLLRVMLPASKIF